MPDTPKPKDVCPECGADLTNLDPRAHALDHWPEKIEERPDNKEARRRQAILYDLAEKRRK